jgi:hypothetical protein
MFEHGRMSSAAATLAPAPAVLSGTAEQVQELQARIRGMQTTKLDTRSLPTIDALGRLLPGGALKQGAAYSVVGSTSLAMALLAAASEAGSWCAVVGVPDFGIEAAAGMGIELERLVLVPSPGDQWLPVTAALLDVLTLVVLRPPARVPDAAASRLAARLRQRGATLVTLGDWPQTEAQLRVTESRWSGIGAGHGVLRGRQVTVSVSARYHTPRSAVARTGRLWLPDAEGRAHS